jgi:hypothetical protein
MESQFSTLTSLYADFALNTPWKEINSLLNRRMVRQLGVKLRIIFSNTYDIVTDWKISASLTDPFRGAGQ